MFYNTVSEIIGFNLYPLQNHTLKQMFEQITPGTPFLILLLAFVFVKLLFACIRRIRNNGASIESMVVVEALEPFYSMLKTKDREFWFREEVGCRDRMAIKRI